MVSPSTKKAAVYGMNSDIPLTCPRPLGGRGHLTIARGDSTMRSFVICFEDNMGVTWGRSFWIRPPFIWIEEISDSLIWTGAVGLDCITAPPKNDVYNEARYIFLLLCQAFL